MDSLLFVETLNSVEERGHISAFAHNGVVASSRAVLNLEVHDVGVSTACMIVWIATIDGVTIRAGGLNRGVTIGP